MIPSMEIISSKYTKSLRTGLTRPPAVRSTIVSIEREHPFRILQNGMRGVLFTRRLQVQKRLWDTSRIGTSHLVRVSMVKIKHIVENIPMAIFGGVPPRASTSEKLGRGVCFGAYALSIIVSNTFAIKAVWTHTCCALRARSLSLEKPW